MSTDWLDRINWNSDGLVPAIAQDWQSGRVLMQAWVNREALALAVEENRAVYWSRSRQKLWRKGKNPGMPRYCIACTRIVTRTVLFSRLNSWGELPATPGVKAVIT